MKTQSIYWLLLGDDWYDQLSSKSYFIYRPLRQQLKMQCMQKGEGGTLRIPLQKNQGNKWEKKINTSNFSINDNISYQCRSFYPRKSRCQTHPVKKNELQSHQVFSEKLWTPISLDHSQVCVFKSGIASNRAHSALLDSIIWDRDITTYNANEKI